MSVSQSITLTPFAPGQLLTRLGERARRRRLVLALTREALADASGVPASTIKRFETRGEIGTRALVMLLAALGQSDQIEALFESGTPSTLDAMLQPERRRGRRRPRSAVA